MATIAPLGKYRAFDDNGDPLSGGKLYTYEAGTTTPKATFTTEVGDVSNANPVILDSSGYADVWLGTGGYKFVLTDSDDVTIFTVDNIGGTNSTAFGAQVNELNSNTNITSLYANSVNICTGTITLSLSEAVNVEEGFYISVKNEGSGIVTIDPDASETIDGQATKAVNPGESALIITDGVEWYTLFFSISADGDNVFTGDNTFTGTVTLPAGQEVNGVTLTDAGDSTDYLSADGTYTKPQIAPTFQYLSVSGTYTTPANCTAILVEIAGAGGEGGGYSAGAGNNGGATTWDTGGSPIVAEGGLGGGIGNTQTTAPGAGGAGGTGAATERYPGNPGIGGARYIGGPGGSHPFFGGAGFPGNTSGSGATNGTRGGGGAGEGTSSNDAPGGKGGGSGEAVRVYIIAPAASYDFTIGAGGTGGGSGTNGGNGYIRVTEYY